MFKELESYLRKVANVSEADLLLIESRAVVKTLRRKQALLIAGEVCRYKAFIASGFLRTYRLKDDGSEHIIQFSPENNWAIDPESYDNVIPSHYNIDALEDSEVILWTKKDFDYLLVAIPQLKLFAEKLISRNIYLGRERVFNNISCTAEEKYDEFIKTNPDVFNRVPLHMVASYLGVSRETLSRIRHAQVKG
jgi:CRP-like cAMP-binding protein